MRPDPLRRPTGVLLGKSLSAETSRVAPGPAGCPRLQRPLRYYVARRLDETEIYSVSRTELEPLTHLHYQSDAAFQWGCSTAGSLFELAFAMLANTTEHRPTDLVCEMFSVEVVACLDPAGFVISSEDIAAWLIAALPDGETSPRQHKRRDHAGLGRRAAGWVRALFWRT
jgi:hypothetical protein